MSYVYHIYQKSPIFKHRSIEEIKKNYESSLIDNEVTNVSQPSTLKKSKKSKVKQIASMFNSKVSQFVNRDMKVGKYNNLINEYSPESKPIVKSTKTSKKPVPKPRILQLKEEAPILRLRTTKLASVQPKLSACFVAEDVFANLSVKEKARLYMQFIEEMFKKNPQFGKHVPAVVVKEQQPSVKKLLKDLESNSVLPKQKPQSTASQKINSLSSAVNRAFTQSPTIKAKESEDIEQKSSVKDLLEEIEFNSVFPKQKTHSAALERMDSMKKACAARKMVAKRNADSSSPTIEAKDFANFEEKNATCGDADSSSPTIKAKEFEDIEEKNPACNDATKSQEKANSLPRKERELTTAYNTLFENQQIENLFFSWFKEKHENTSNNIIDSDKQSVIDEEQQKSAIDNLLEEAIAKLECIKGEQNVEEEVESSTPRNNISQQPSSSPFSKTSANESESGLSSLPKLSSEESSPPEDQENKSENAKIDFEFVKPSKSLRKRKMRKINVLKKENSVKETNEITTTDSDTDLKRMVAENKQQCKKSQDDSVNIGVPTDLLEIDQSLIRNINSTTRIKSAYTLTVLATPLATPRTSLNLAPAVLLKKDFACMTECLTDQGFETGFTDKESPKRVVKKPETEINTSTLQSPSNTSTTTSFVFTTPTKPESHSTCQNAKNVACMTENFTDQGFETAFNDTESPQNFNKRPKTDVNNSEPQSILNANKTTSFGFSTPIKPESHYPFTTPTAKQQLFSPINKVNKNRRRSIYDSEPRRSSLSMQVIKEGQLFETSPSKQTERLSNAKAETKKKAEEPAKLGEEKTSEFWIKCGDFAITLEINYTEAERLRLLYEIYSQTSCETKDLHFGIDDQKFSVHEPAENWYTSKCLPPSQGNSHYWFATGDLTIPFSGKQLATNKIQRIFRLIKETVEETGTLRFGVDHIEFSNVPEFWEQTAKFSVESQYDMLVGLQSGNSNGLEGRSKYAWPHRGPITDLDQSYNDNLQEIKSGQPSQSTFNNNHNDLSSLDNIELSMARTSLNTMSSESYWGEYENEPLDQLFGVTYRQPQSSKKHISTPTTKTVPEMVSVLQKGKERLSWVKEQLSSIPKSSLIPKDALDHLKGTPEYFEKLKEIVADINNLGCNNKLKDCTVDELESYMYYLTRYTEICLSSCGRHMDTVLDAIAARKATVV